MRVVERQRKQRSDAGEIRQTSRDAVLLEWMSHMYGLPQDLLQHGLDVSQVRTYQLVRRWRDAGWVQTGRHEPGRTWVWPTRGVATQYLGWETNWAPKPTTVPHTRAVAALRLHRSGWDLSRWISERQLRHEAGGYRKRGKAEPHLPDGIEVLPDGRRVLIEVELTAKSPQRMWEVIQDVDIRAGELNCSAVGYWVTPGAARIVQDAIERHRREWGDRTPFYVSSIEEVPGWKVEVGG